MKTLLPIASLAIALTSGLQGSSITSAGTLVNLTPPGFGTGTDVADLDASTAGTSGFVLFNVLPEGDNVSNAAWDLNIVDNKPAYVTAIDGTGSTSSGGWANYDDVTVGGTKYNTGGIARAGVGDGTEAQSFTFTVGPGVPPTMRIGLIADNSDSANWDVRNVRIEGPGGVTANQDVIIDGGSDLVQFDIAGALDGEVYTIYGTSPPSGALLGGITFDSALDITDPTDGDGDTIGDNWEIFYFGDVTVTDGTGDAEPDGLTDLEEWQAGTDPTNPDTDGDGVNDGGETSNANGSVTDPNNPDTDGDGFDDGQEIAAGTNPDDPNSKPRSGTVTAAGTLVNLTPPGFAIGTDNADLDVQTVGTDGFVLFNVLPEGDNVSNATWDLNIVDNKPAYISTLDGTGSTSSGGWANYDDVTIGGALYNTGGIVRSVGDGVEAQSFTFTVGAGVPPVLQIGLIVDNSDSANWDVSNVRVEGPGGSTADQPVAIDGGTDLVQFDITGAINGEIYTVYGTSPPSGILIGGITFDNLSTPTLFLDVEGDGDNLILTWPSANGKLYNVRSEVDPSTGFPIDWPIFGNNSDITATPPENTLVIPRPADPFRLFVVEEFDAPPMKVFTDDFESGQGDWTVDNTVSGADPVTNWEFGTPDNTLTGGPASANSGTTCFGTNLAGYTGLNVSVSLTSPVVDLTAAAGATLNFSQFRDIDDGFDFGEIRVLDADDADALLAVIVDTDNDGVTGTGAGWEDFSVAVPAAALGANVKFEFTYLADDTNVGIDYAGWYIDDVCVTVP